MNPLTSIKFVFVCKALAWRAYLTIFLLYQHNNIKRNPRMRWWVIDTIWSFCLIGPSFVIEIRVLPSSILVTVGRIGSSRCLCGTGVGVHLCKGFPVSPVLCAFVFPLCFIKRWSWGTRCHAMRRRRPKLFRFPGHDMESCIPRPFFLPFDNIRGCSIPGFNVPSACHRSW